MSCGVLGDCDEVLGVGVKTDTDNTCVLDGDVVPEPCMIVVVFVFEGSKVAAWKFLGDLKFTVLHDIAQGGGGRGSEVLPGVANSSPPPCFVELNHEKIAEALATTDRQYIQ